MKINKTRLRRFQKAEKPSLGKSTKKRLDWYLDKLNDLAIGAYGLMSAENWMKLYLGSISNNEMVKLIAASAVLALVWIIIGLLKGQLEGME